ncbi:hypothetical protein OAL10_10305 [Gammaproteobacteria bacterium]|nr:hypothetical protein [Gammaproteobacteria bacterium]
MESDLFDLYEELDTFELDERFSRPIWEFYFSLRSLMKYWILTRDLMGSKIYANSDFFDELDYDDEASSDYINIPYIQRNHTICTGYTLVEVLLREVCKELDEDFVLNDKGSYIQQHYHYIRQHTSIRIAKNYMKDFDSFGQLRNYFIHQFKDFKLPEATIEHLNLISGDLLKIEKGVTNAHVEVLLKTLSNFGSDFQNSYWAAFDEDNES